jgi:DNA-binding response OmpR family regulator
MTTPNVNASTPLPVPVAASPPGRSALVVDDEAMIRRIARVALEGAGFGFAEAGNAAEAVAAVKSANPPFDLILLDLTLPDGAGTSVIPVIRRHSPGTRVLVVSGLGEDAVGSGSDGFLAKPFTKSSLLIAIQLAFATAGPPVPPGRP